MFADSAAEHRSGVAPAACRDTSTENWPLDRWGVLVAAVAEQLLALLISRRDPHRRSASIERFLRAEARDARVDQSRVDLGAGLVIEGAGKGGIGEHERVFFLLAGVVM